MKLVLGLIIFLLGVVLAVQWSDWPPQTVRQPAAGGEESQEPATSPGAESPLDLLAPPEDREEYAVVVDRPLFLPDRRPPSEEPEEQAESPPAQDAELGRLDLNAVIITPAKAIAWVRDPTEKELQDVELGDELSGWVVKEILADRLVLERQGETDTLTLRDYQNMPRTRPQVPPQPQQVSPRRALNPSDRPQSLPPKSDGRRARRARATSQPPPNPEQ